MLIDKYNRIIIEKLPAKIATEIKQIADDTENFNDEELVEIYKDNFNDLFKIIESKHPEALKAKKKLVKKASEKKKIVKKAEPKKKLVKKAEAKKKIVKLECKEAKKIVEAIQQKKADAAKKRAEAPKKKVTTAAREKQIKTIASVFKTKDFKADKKQAEGFAKDLVAVYSKYGLKSMADQLEKDIQELIDTKYKPKKMAEGGQVDEEYVDLFDDYDSIPPKVQKVLEKHSAAFENGSYEGLQKAKADMEKIGYTFEYYVDGSAYDLRKKGQKGLSEQQ